MKSLVKILIFSSTVLAASAHAQISNNGYNERDKSLDRNQFNPNGLTILDRFKEYFEPSNLSAPYKYVADDLKLRSNLIQPRDIYYVIEQATEEVKKIVNIEPPIPRNIHQAWTNQIQKVLYALELVNPQASGRPAFDALAIQKVIALINEMANVRGQYVQAEVGPLDNRADISYYKMPNEYQNLLKKLEEILTEYPLTEGNQELLVDMSSRVAQKHLRSLALTVLVAQSDKGVRVDKETFERAYNLFFNGEPIAHYKLSNQEWSDQKNFLLPRARQILSEYPTEGLNGELVQAPCKSLLNGSKRK